ncbi:hypothetical protein FC093_08725 [Ilyomonas limi]|uniref:Uncharacterized protein n=1 Tax=Ilyomonas limi TaxID=2575867 RepID=A0A4U3L390_9BACT|nr:hypothetical protein [Ilyomonas limi]TKK69390.1 hypothetical protein FC093_08725 [Ilyomonas limi]
METKQNMQEEKGNIHNTPGSASLPKGNINDTGVKNGIGISDAPGKKNSISKQTGNNRSRPFSNERPIF